MMMLSPTAIPPKNFGKQKRVSVNNSATAAIVSKPSPNRMRKSPSKSKHDEIGNVRSPSRLKSPRVDTDKSDSPRISGLDTKEN